MYIKIICSFNHYKTSDINWKTCFVSFGKKKIPYSEKNYNNILIKRNLPIIRLKTVKYVSSIYQTELCSESLN